MTTTPQPRLALRLTISFVIPTLLALLTIGILADYVAQRTFEEQLSERLIAIAQAASSRFDSKRYTSGPKAWAPERFVEDKETGVSHLRERMYLRIQPIWKRTGVRRIFVFRPDKTSVVDTRHDQDVQQEEHLYEIEPDDFELQTLIEAGTPTASVLYWDSDGVPYKYAYAPIVNDKGEVLAIVGVEDSAASIALIRDFRRALWLLGLGGVILIIAASIFISRWLTRPVRRLVDAARQIGDGDLNHPIATTRTDEVGVLEQSLEDMRKALLDRDQQMQMMLSGIAHEVRNPLGGIKLFLGLLDEDLRDEGRDKEDPVREHVTKIQRELDYLNRVVQEFLEYARHRTVDQTRFEAKPFMDELVQVMAGDLMSHGVDLKVTLDDAARELTADRDRLRRVVLNLIRNACQASLEGDVLSLNLEAPAPDQRRLVIRDEGTGIPAEKLKDIFKPFYTTRQKGTGLGLPLTRKIMQDHGGDVTLSSVVGEGTTVTLEWPFLEDLVSPELDIPEGWLG